MKKNVDSIPAATMTALCEYHWPGNIRESTECDRTRRDRIHGVRAERIYCRSQAPVTIPRRSDEKNAANCRLPTLGMPEERLMKNERQQILGILEATHWTVAGPNGAASRLGLKRSTLQYFRMRKLGIPSRRESL